MKPQKIPATHTNMYIQPHTCQQKNFLPNFKKTRHMTGVTKGKNNTNTHKQQQQQQQKQTNNKKQTKIKIESKTRTSVKLS